MGTRGDLPVVALTNAFGALPEKISGGIAAMYIPGLQPKRHAVKMSTAALDAFTGKYQVTQGLLTVSRIEGQLALDMAVGPGSIHMGTLTPEGKASFDVSGPFDSAMLVISGITPYNIQKADYSLDVTVK